LKKVLTVLPILLFSGLFGFFLWQIYFVYNKPGYSVDWHGWWITSTKLKGDVFYFRKEFNLSDNIKNAWLLASASDEFELYLNGKSLGTAELGGWFPIGIYDVTEAIHSGINALGIRVQKRSFDGSVKAVLEVGYEDINGNKHFVFSDETWRVSNKEERSSTSGLYWYDKGFNDASWVNAKVLGRPKGLWLNLDPRIYTTSASGLWFWAGKQREISCQLEVHIPKKPTTAWIRLASMGGFRLLINKEQIDVQEDIIGTENESVPTTSAPEAGAPLTEKTLRIYEIGPFLKLGSNNILIPAYAEGSSRGLYIDGIIEGDGWSKKIDETDFKCFYSGESTPLLTYKGNPGWTSIKNKEIKQDIYIPLQLSISSYSILLFIFCISSVVFIGLTFVFSGISRLPFYSISRIYFIPSLFLMFIYILGYDKRFYESFPFQTKFLILSLCLFILMLFWSLKPLIRIKDLPKWVPGVIFILIFLVGVFLRFKGITQESLHPDEASLVVKAQGVLDRGYPSIRLALESPAWYVATSELLSYMQALSFIVFGKSEFSLRLPGVLFGILTIPLLYYFGKMIGGARVGLLASATYSLLSSAIGMTHFARYPSQLAFFGFLTGFLAFLYLKTDKFRYLCLCALSFLLTYFTWQGSGLILLPLFLMRIIMGKKERILKDIIVFLFIIVPPVVIHLLIRTSQFIAYVSFMYGRGVSSITPTPMFLSPFYDPFYYIQNFFFIEGHQFISILFFAGIPLVFIKFRTYRELLFLYMVPLIIPFLMSNTLEISNYRYAYYVLPYLILCACRVLFVFLGYLGYDKKNRSLSFINSVFASLILIVISSGFFLNLKGLPEVAEDTPISTSDQLFITLKNLPTATEAIKTNQSLRYFSETYEAVKFIKANMGPGDVIVSYQPHLLGYYLDKVDYFFESRLLLSVVIIPQDSNFITVHRVSGTPAILSLNELKRIIGAGRKRVWLVGSPENPAFLDRDSHEFLDNNKKVIFETYKTRVYLIGGG